MRFISGNLRASGSLVALAVGDALGAPLEGSAQPSVWLTEMLPGGLHFRKRGQITDDTLQAMAVAESLVSRGYFDQKDLISRLISKYESRPEWFGPTSSAFFELVKSGTLPQRAAWIVHKRLHGSRSNGSVMRGFPLGIRYSSQVVYDVSLACSQISHYDPVAAHCSAWLNVMVSDMCRGLSRSAAYRHARSLCTHDEVHAVLGSYENYALNPSLDAVLCSHAALVCFMHARTLEGAILSAINLGGDADTVGACCGALAGAYWGLEAIPLRWRKELEDYDYIMRLADLLWDCTGRSR
ncbi:MAG: ADP-ribosylglycohydrolase family protein [Methanoregula sp.]|nr:ADP-ribosylglycohydrolase family protein [Methanoregula sp.]